MPVHELGLRWVPALNFGHDLFRSAIRRVARTIRRMLETWKQTDRPEIKKMPGHEF